MFLKLAPYRGLVRLRRVSCRQVLFLQDLAAGGKDVWAEPYKAMRWAFHIQLQLYNSCGGYCLSLEKQGEAGQMVLLDPGLSGWVLKLGRDNEHAGHLKQHVHRLKHTKRNRNLGNHERIYTARKYHSWGGGGYTKSQSILKFISLWTFWDALWSFYFYSLTV